MLHDGGEKQIKVLFLTHYSQLYGANRSLLDLLDGLKKFPVRPIVVSTEAGDLLHQLNKRSLKNFIVPFKLGVEYRWKSRNRFFQTLRDTQFFFVALKKAALNELIYYHRLKNIIKSEAIDIIYTNSSVITIGHALSRRLNIPQVYHVRELVVQQFSLFPDFGSNFFRKSISRLTHQIFISQFVKNCSITGNMKNYTVIPDGIQAHRFNRRKENFQDNTANIGVIGYLCAQKNQSEAIRAVRKLKQPNVKLVVIGGGDIGAFRRMVEASDIRNKVIFTGYKNDIEFYNDLDIVIVPAINEALGRVTIEAMLCGIPVIGKDSGATPELIEHGKTGFIYKDESDLTEKLHQLVVDKELRSLMGKAAYLSAKKRFCLDGYAKRIFEILSLLHIEK